MKPSRKDYILSVYGREPETLDELAQCVIAVINSQLNGVPHSKSSKKPANYRVVGFCWEIAHRELVCNTHSSPEGYPLNWERRHDVPKGYPGWMGRVWIRYADTLSGWGSDPFEKTLTHTGTGGRGSYDGPWRRISEVYFQRYRASRNLPKQAYPASLCYSWDYRFYDLDWPVLAANIVKSFEWDQMVAALSQKSCDRPRHRFLWEDPEVQKADREFIADVQNWERA